MEHAQWDLQDALREERGGREAAEAALDKERSGREATEAEAARMATRIRSLELFLALEHEQAVRGRHERDGGKDLADEAMGASTTSRHKAKNVRMKSRRRARRGRPGARARRRAAGYPIAPGG